MVAHDEREDERDFVVRGRARLICDGEDVVVEECGLLCVGGEVERSAWALATPTALFMAVASREAAAP